MPRFRPKRIARDTAEKSFCSFSWSPVPQTDTGRWDEYSKARERNLFKELGKIAP